MQLYRGGTALAKHRSRDQRRSPAVVHEFIAGPRTDWQDNGVRPTRSLRPAVARTPFCFLNGINNGQQSYQHQALLDFNASDAGVSLDLDGILRLLLRMVCLRAADAGD